MKDKEQTDSNMPQHEADISDDGTEHEDGLHEFIRAEREEKARSLLESGLAGSEAGRSNICMPTGDGFYSKLVRASVGETEDQRAEHLKSLRRADEAAFPELQLWKRTPPAKIAAHQTPLSDLADKDKQPSHLTKTHVVNLYSAIAYANSRGAIFNVHLSIRWDLLQITDHAEAADALQKKFLQCLNQWYADRMKAQGRTPGDSDTQELYWLYVHECPPPKYRFHTHCLVSIPSEFKSAFQSWVTGRINAIWTDNGGEKEAPSKALKVEYRPTDTIDRQWVWLQYLCKGVDPTVTVKINREIYKKSPPSLLSLLEVHYISPGPIRCSRRMGMSQNMSPTKRKNAGFQSEMDQGRFDCRTLFTSKVFDAWRTEQARQRAPLPDMSEAFKALLSK
jgi:hypothetical protein